MRGSRLKSNRLIRVRASLGGSYEMAVSAESLELAEFGYKQELERSLGSFSSFAAGFSYISILTGVFQLFFFGFATGGPAFLWTWPMVFIGQLLVALCF